MTDRAALPRPPMSNSRLVATINRTSCQWRENPTHSFLGFTPIGGDYVAWGVEIDGSHYAATHLFLHDLQWGDDRYDTEEISMTRPWVVMFLGGGDRSFYRRFETEDEAIEHFESIDEIHFADQGTFRYTS